MRFFSVLLLIFSLLPLSSALAAQKSGGKEPAKTPAAPAAPTERIYLDVEVYIDPIEQIAVDQNGRPISGTIQKFYSSGRLASETQWVDGRLHGVTRNYYENRTLMEETTWVNGQLHGPARLYDETGALRRENMYENGRDLSAPAGPDAAQGQSAQDQSADGDKAPAEAPSAKTGEGEETKQ